MDDASPVLLAVVEVDEWDAVACRAAGCNHKVFRAIHVVRADGQVTVLGSSCFKKLYGASEIGRARPRFTSGGGRTLSDEERALLQENAAELIRQFQAATLQHPSPSKVAPPARNKHRRVLFADPLAGVAPELIAEAKRNVAQRYGCDPDQAGWKGLVVAEVQTLLRRDAAS